LLHVVHHVEPGEPDAGDRVGFFFEADHCVGEPVNAEPHWLQDARQADTAWVYVDGRSTTCTAAPST
jgi:hypothetical protein